MRPLDLQLVEQKRGAGDAEPDWLGAVFCRGRGSGGDEIAAQRADVEISEDATAHEFFMRVFGPYAIEEPGFEAWAHSFHVEPVGQVALFAEFDQFCFEAGVGLGIGRLQNKIAGVRSRRGGGGGASMTIRSGKVANGLASDEVGDELSFLDERDALGFHAFVVERVVAEQRLAGNGGNRRVVEHIDEIGQHAGLITAGPLSRGAGVLAELRFTAEKIRLNEFGDNGSGSVVRKQDRPAIFLVDDRGVSQQP